MYTRIMEKKAELETIAFASAAKWEAWLRKNHASSQGLWVRLFKKNSGVKSVTYDEALLAALCYGWIDGQKNKHDAESWVQKFTPRRARSMWSKRNIQHVERLIAEGKMTAAGMREIEAAKADGRWARAYDAASDMKVPEDFLKELSKNKKAKAFFDTLNKANTYAIAWRLQTAKKPETRERRMKVLLEMMKKGERVH